MSNPRKQKGFQKKYRRQVKVKIVTSNKLVTVKYAICNGELRLWGYTRHCVNLKTNYI